MNYNEETGEFEEADSPGISILWCLFKIMIGIALIPVGVVYLLGKLLLGRKQHEET